MITYNLGYDYSLKLGNKELKFRPWTTKEEKNYFLARDDESVTPEKIFDILVRPCLEDKTAIFSLEETKYILIKIREVSIGGSFSLRFTCPNEECKSTNIKDVSLTECVTFKEPTYGIATAEDVTITFGRVKSKSALEKISLAKNTVEKFFLEMVFSVEKIKYKSQEFESFTAEEVGDFLDSLPTKIMDKISEEFIKMKPLLSIKTKQKCFKCGKETEVHLEKIPNFLWE